MVGFILWLLGFWASIELVSREVADEKLIGVLGLITTLTIAVVYSFKFLNWSQKEEERQKQWRKREEWQKKKEEQRRKEELEQRKKRQEQDMAQKRENRWKIRDYLNSLEAPHHKASIYDITQHIVPPISSREVEKLCREMAKDEYYHIGYDEKFDRYFSWEFKGQRLSAIDKMDGHQFEHYCAGLLRKLKYTDVEVTKGSGDQGVDIIAVKDGVRYAIQCKRYSSPLGNSPVQEVSAGKQLYNCQVGVVLTNQHFTAGAKQLAAATGVLLWDRDELGNMIEQAGK